MTKNKYDEVLEELQVEIDDANTKIAVLKDAMTSLRVALEAVQSVELGVNNLVATVLHRTEEV